MITMAEAAQATGGHWLSRPLSDTTPLRRGAFDSRQPGNAKIFFALPGEQADGHDFLDQLARSSFKLAVVSRAVHPAGFGGNVLRVPDVRAALGQLGAFARAKYAPQVVAVTGSYGKTTAKEIIAHVIGKTRKVLKTPGTRNNEIGLPLTLLELDGSQDTVVLEFSARREGDIDYLGRIAPPHIAILLAVGRAHMGVFGSQEAIYRAKGEIFTHLRPAGLALVGAEDRRLRELAQGHRLCTFGRGVGDYRAEEICSDAQGRQRFTAVKGSGMEEQRLFLRSGMVGAHGIYPLLVAWAVARELGVPDAQVAARAGFNPEQSGRSRLYQAPGGAVVVDDTYNASPETIVNLIATLASMEGKERMLVLGDLSELEAGLKPSAALIGRALRPPLTRCLVYAPACPGLPEMLAAAAHEGCEVACCSSAPALIDALRGWDKPGRLIGIKAARSAHLERVVQGLLGADIACELKACTLLKRCTDCEQMVKA